MSSIGKLNLDLNLLIFNRILEQKPNLRKALKLPVVGLNSGIFTHRGPNSFKCFGKFGKIVDWRLLHLGGLVPPPPEKFYIRHWLLKIYDPIWL